VLILGPLLCTLCRLLKPFLRWLSIKLKRSSHTDRDLLCNFFQDSIEEALEPLRKELMDLNEVEKNFSGIQVWMAI